MASASSDPPLASHAVTQDELDAGTNIVNTATVTGTGVTFILTSTNASNNPSSIGQVTVNGGATMQLSAPTSGPYAGILFYQDRRAPNVDGNRINGNSSSSYQGAFYFPGQGMDFNGTAGISAACRAMAVSSWMRASKPVARAWFLLARVSNTQVMTRLWGKSA